MADADDPKDPLPGVAARVDALRAGGLKGLDRAAGARQGSLQREHRRLARRLGEDHPRVLAVAARIEGALALRRELAIEVVRAETPSPQPGPQEWALHGYVRWADGSPARDLTVSLVDGRGQWLRELGYACTDARGYFKLVARVEHAADGSAAILTAFVRVTNDARHELHRGQEALPVLPGVVEYREIVLDGSSRACSTPEEEPGPETSTTRTPRTPRAPRARKKGKA